MANPNPSLSSSIVSICSKRRKGECSHPVILEGSCLLCERVVHDDHSLPFDFLHPCLRLSHEYANRMRETSTRAALELKKLHLVLDLDHTLLHTIRVSNLTPEEEERLKHEAERNAEGVSEGRGDIFLFDSETGEGFITKLRPFVREFVREADQMFELTVYTMGGRTYSSRMTKVLDPDRKYFSDRVIAREDCPLKDRKRLDVVLAKESNILIMDDTETVWRDHAYNLIVVGPFYYFSHGSKKRRVQPSFGHDEGDQDSVLLTALQVLKEIHKLYFDPKLGLKGRDVRELTRQVQVRVHDAYGDQALSGDAPKRFGSFRFSSVLS